MNGTKKEQVLANLDQMTRNAKARNDKDAAREQEAAVARAKVNDYISGVAQPILAEYADLLRANGATASVSVDEALTGQKESDTTVRVNRRVILEVKHEGREGSVSVSASTRGVVLDIQPPSMTQRVVQRNRSAHQAEAHPMSQVQAPQIEEAVKTMTDRMASQP